jgi:RHS repeat-associated protein
MVNNALRKRLLYRKKLNNFTGKELDAETGLYYYGARYLDPKTSRWLSGDPALGEYFPVAPVNDEAKKRNQNLPGQGGVFNYVNLHAYHYAGNNPVKYTDSDGRTGSFPDGSPEQDAQWEKAIDTKRPAEKITYTKIGLPESGPCNMSTLIGIAEEYAGKNLSKNELKKLVNNLTTGSSPLVDINKGYEVINDIGVVAVAIDMLLGTGTSENLNIVITRPSDTNNYPIAKANAMYSMLAVGTLNNSSEPGHWQVGDSKGNFLWDPLSGRNSGGRVIFGDRTRYVRITPREK